MESRSLTTGSWWGTMQNASGNDPAAAAAGYEGAKPARRIAFDAPVILLSAPAVLALLGLFIYPFLYGLFVSLTDANAGGFTLANYQRFFGDSREVQALWTTLRVALPATAVIVLTAVPLAYQMRRRLPGEAAIRFALVWPVTLGVVLIAEGMSSYFGPRGWFNQLLAAVGLISEPVRLTHNYIGVEIAIFVSTFPFAFLMLVGYVSGISPDLEKAARVHGASPWQVFSQIMLPLMAPGIAIVASLTFVMSFGTFPSAILVGEPAGATRVLSIAAYQAAYEKFDLPMGSTISLIMGATELAVVGLVFLWRAGLYRGVSSVGKG